MMRWFAKRWVLAGVFGTTAALGLALAQAGKDAPAGPPKVGDVLTLPFQNGLTKQVKVLKVEKQPDGSYLSEVKDTKTGETFTLYDAPTEPSKAPAKSGSSSREKEANLPKAKQRPTDPLLPSINTPMPPTPKDQETKDRGFKLFGDRSTPSTTDPASAEPQKRPGLLSRIFGRKSSTPSTTMPAATSTSSKPAMSAPAINPSTPPAVRPTPNLTSPNMTTKPQVPAPGGTGEPPRVPLKPSAATPPLLPNPNTPAPLPIPVPPSNPPAPTSPAAPPVLPSTPPIALPTNPPPVALPSPPPAAIPAVPPPAGSPGGLPPIPIPPGGVSKTPSTIVPATTPVTPSPTSPVMPAAMPAPAPAGTSLTVPPEIQPTVTKLQSGFAPSERIRAAQSLANGRHGSTDAVKAIIFQACTSDPCALVRACCIDELSKLGYQNPAFHDYLKKAVNDPSEDVRFSAKAAMTKLGMQK